MIQSFLIASTIIIGLMLVWVAVQSGWRNLFRDHITDDDVLADRRSCGNCGCSSGVCTKDRATRATIQK